jgi:hypothetical protein
MPNRDAWEKNSSSPYPYIVLYHYRFGILFPLLTHGDICPAKAVVPRNDHDIWAHHDMVADAHGAIDLAVHAKTRVIANLNTSPTAKMSSSFYIDINTHAGKEATTNASPNFTCPSSKRCS